MMVNPGIVQLSHDRFDFVSSAVVDDQEILRRTGLTHYG
jgi:hypothetical protein